MTHGRLAKRRGCDLIAPMTLVIQRTPIGAVFIPGVQLRQYEDNKP